MPGVARRARPPTASEQPAATKTAAMANVHGIATEAAAAIVERLIGKTPDNADVAAAVGEVLKQ